MSDMSTTGIVTTVAGGGKIKVRSDTASPAQTKLRKAYGLAMDARGNLYIADSGNHRVRMISGADGSISTVAGNGRRGFHGDSGPATQAKLRKPYGVTVDARGNLYIADSGNNRVRKVSAVDRTITTVAGTGKAGFSGDGGPATQAEIDFPSGLAVDAHGNLYIAAMHNFAVRKVSVANGTITTVAGTGELGFSGDGGQASEAELRLPSDVAIDSHGNLYIVDFLNHRARKVSVDGTITTVAGSGTCGFRGGGFSGDRSQATDAEMREPYGAAVDRHGNLYIADSGNGRVRKVSAEDGTITTVVSAGKLGSGADPIPTAEAQRFHPARLVVGPRGALYITTNERVYKVSMPASER